MLKNFVKVIPKYSILAFLVLILFGLLMRNLNPIYSIDPTVGCGILDGQEFLVQQEDWPSGEFCEVGLPTPVLPNYPQPGQQTGWECSHGEGIVSCSASRADYPPTCGTLDGQVFSAEDENWPSSDFCEHGISNPFSPVYPNPGESTSWQCVKDESSVNCLAQRSFPLPWIATRGGLVHVDGEVNLPIKSVLYTEEETDVDERTSLSSELLTFGAEYVLDVGWGEKIYELNEYGKRINNSWYDILVSRAEARNPVGNLWTVLDVEEDLISHFGLSSTEGSEIIKLTLAELELCKIQRHIYFVDGDLEVNPEEYESLGMEDVNGCIFIVRGDVNIEIGEYKSEGLGTPQYDLIRGFFISDGVINIKEDFNANVSDGLKVVGSLFATGGVRSINLERSLYMHNLDYPTLIVFHDARYLNLAREVFGSIGHVKEIGFKNGGGI